MKKNIVFILLLSLSLASCESTTQSTMPITSGSGGRVFILDEGGYGHNDAHLDEYNLTTGTLATDLIEPLGDVGNDLQYINGKLYAVLDNSDKIVVIDPDSVTNRHIISFPTGGDPGKIVQVSPTIAMVSDLYASVIYVVNLTKDSVTASVPVSAGQSGVTLFGGKLYAASGANTVIAIDPILRTTSAEKYIGEIPMQVLGDSIHSSLLVLTSGNYSPKTPGKILWVNPNTLAVTDSIVIDTNHYVNEIVMGGTKAYVLYNDGVKTIDLASHALTTDALFTKAYFGGYFDPVDNYLYLGTAKDFQNNDVVDIYDMNAHTLKKTLNVGIAPAFFAIVG